VVAAADAAADAAAANVMASGADLLHGLAALDVVIVASAAAFGAVVAAVAAAVAAQPRGAEEVPSVSDTTLEDKHGAESGADVVFAGDILSCTVRESSRGAEFPTMELSRVRLSLLSHLERLLLLLLLLLL
jgi:hypothetical protein